jgi:hypothetical protein
MHWNWLRVVRRGGYNMHGEWDGFALPPRPWPMLAPVVVPPVHETGSSRLRC